MPGFGGKRNANGRGDSCRSALLAVFCLALTPCASAAFVPADRQLDGVTLPEGYMLLSAVSSTGEQYVDLEVEPDDKTACEITLRDDTTVRTNDWFVLGVREAYKNKAYYFSTCVDGNWAWYLASGDGGVLPFSSYRSGFNVVTFTAQRRVYVNNQFLSQMDAGEVVTGRNLYLFTVNDNGSPKNCSTISVRRIKIWKDGLLVRDCVGAVDSNDDIGLYDLVSGRFFVSATEVGLEVAGPDNYVPEPAHELLKDVRLPAGYELLEYVSSTGAQYLDTEIVPDETVAFDLAFRNHETTKDTHLFGSRLAYENNAVGFSIQTTTMRTHFSNVHLDYGGSPSGGDLGFRTVALTASHAVYVDGVQGTPLNPTEPTIDNEHPIYLFTCNDNGKPHSQYSSIDLRNCRIWKGGELVRDYVPARHGDEVGLYDLVGESFKPADSETPLVAGPAAADEDHLPPEKQLLGVSLPGEYVLLSHVRTDASSTGVYFDTGVTADGTTAYEVTFRDERRAGDTDEMMILGSRKGYGTNDLSLSKSNWLKWRYGDIKWDEQYAAPTELDFCVVKFETPCLKVNSGLLAEVPSLADMTENGLNVYLFTLNNNGRPHEKYAKVSLRRCRLWKTGRLVRDYVPAWRKADGAVGLYDLVEKEFRPPEYGDLQPGRPINPDGTDLTDGLLDRVKLPPGHRLLDYVWSTGTQYVNTGVTPDGTVTYEITYRNDGKTSVSQQILGSRVKFRENALALSIQGSGEGADSGFACHISDVSCYTGAKKYFDGFHTYRFDSSRRFTVDGVLLDTLRPNVAEFSTDLPIYVFNLNNNGSLHTQAARISVRRFKIWKGGKLVRDFVPDYFENRAGLFDRVGKKFHPADAGELFPGPDYVPLRRSRGTIVGVR